MKIKDILDLPVIVTYKDLTNVIDKFLLDDLITNDWFPEENNQRVTVKVHFINDLKDGRRYYRLSSVWLDESSVFIAKEGGREGDDDKQIYIFNPEKYNELIDYVRSLQKKYSDNHNIFDLEDEISLNKINFNIEV